MLTSVAAPTVLSCQFRFDDEECCPSRITSGYDFETAIPKPVVGPEEGFQVIGERLAKRLQTGDVPVRMRLRDFPDRPIIPTRLAALGLFSFDDA
jgi:hypothetical protein